MTTPSLEGPRLKARRAKSQIDALQTTQDGMGLAGHYQLIKAEFNKETGYYVYRVRVNRPPEPEWGVLIGEIAHNLRSALDGLVYQLVLLNGHTPTTRSGFPIFRLSYARGGKPHFHGRHRGDGLPMIEGVHKSHQAVLEGVQPYKRGQPHNVGVGMNNVLFLLQELSNADKHRLLQVVGFAVGGIGWGAQRERRADDIILRRPVGPSVLKDGTKFLEARPDVNVQSNIAPLITFWKGCRAVEKKGVILTLQPLARHVSEIIERFAPDFPD